MPAPCLYLCSHCCGDVGHCVDLQKQTTLLYEDQIEPSINCYLHEEVIVASLSFEDWILAHLYSAIGIMEVVAKATDPCLRNVRIAECVRILCWRETHSPV